MLAADQIGDPPIRSARHLGDDRIAVKTQKGHGGREYARALILGFIEQFLGRCCDDRMYTCFSQMAGGFHAVQCCFDPARRVRQKCSNACECLVFFCVKDMQDSADKKCVARLFPVVTPFKAAFGIDQDVCDILHIADFAFATPDLQKRIECGRSGIGRVEQ